MFFVRLLLWVVTLPFVLVAHVLKFILFILTAIGSFFTTLIGGLLFLASGVMFIACFWQTGADFWNGFGTSLAGMALGLFIYYLPRVAGFLAGLLEYFIDWVRSITFG